MMCIFMGMCAILGATKLAEILELGAPWPHVFAANNMLAIWYLLRTAPED
jgi:hypothetical protein